MRMDPGYKHTEVGVIPHDWDVVPLCKACTLHNGRAYALHEWERAGTPVIRLQNLTGGEDYYYSNLKLPEQKYCQHGDLLFMWSATFGPRIWTGERAIYHYHIWKVEPHLCKATKEYLFFRLNELTEDKKTRAANGGTMLHVTKGDMEATLIALPKLGEQRAIAAALGDVDALLGGLDRLIANKRDLKQAAMQQLLTGQARLPGFHGEWEVKRLGEVADVKTGPFGSSLHESDYVQDGTPIITVEHLGEFGVDHFNLPLVSNFDRRRLQVYSLAEGDIVFSRVGSVDRNALIRRAEAGWLFSGRLLRVRPDRQKAYAPFLSFQFHSEPFKASVRSVAVGQTMASLNTQILNGVFVSLPSIPEQTAIASVLSDMDAELSALEARRNKTRALKQGMMQELLTGRIRLV